MKNKNLIQRYEMKNKHMFLSAILVLCLVSISMVKNDFALFYKQLTFSSVSFRMVRVQKEEEEAERKKLEAAIQREQEQQEYIKEKEREILKLQVWFFDLSVFYLQTDVKLYVKNC